MDHLLANLPIGSVPVDEHFSLTVARQRYPAARFTAGGFHITIRTMTDETDKRRGLANHMVPITSPPCRTCGMPMRLGLIAPLDEPLRERRIYECLPCKDSVNFVITLP
jgi:hypothetical protein